jgi:hypothetical protein
MAMTNNLYLVWFDTTNATRGHLINFATKAKYTHVALMISNHKERWILAADTTHNAKWINADKFFEYQPWKHMQYVGETKQAWLYLAPKMEYRVKSLPVIWWYFVTRYLYPSWTPKACSSLVNEVLDSLGFNNKNHVDLNKMYKEFESHENNYTIRKSESGQDSCSTTSCKVSI